MLPEYRPAENLLKVCLSVAAALLVVYFPTLFYTFTCYDDQFWLTFPWDIHNRYDILYQFFIPDRAAELFYRPILGLSFYFNYLLGAHNIFLYHLVNLIIHGACSILLYIVLRRLQVLEAAAWVLTMFFTVHPALVEAVVWIPGRTDTLLALFILLSFLCLIFWLDSDRRKGWFAGHIFFLALALGIKESAVMVPFVFVVYLFAVRRINRWQLLSAAGAWLFILVVYFAVRSSVVKAVPSTASVHLALSFFRNLPTVAVYFSKWFFPVQLSVFPLVRNIDYPVVLGVAGLWLALLTVYIRRKDAAMVLFAAVWFLLFTMVGLPLSTVMHEYRLYLPAMGLVILVALLPVWQSRWSRFILYIFPLLFSLFVWINCRYSTAYSDPLIFWQSAVNDAPQSAFAYNNLAMVHAVKGDTISAIAYLKHAVILNDREPLVHYNLGRIYFSLGELDAAYQEFEKELKINPRSQKAYRFLNKVKKQLCF